MKEEKFSEEEFFNSIKETKRVNLVKEVVMNASEKFNQFLIQKPLSGLALNWVINLRMGTGKTTILTEFVKRIISKDISDTNPPLLIVIRKIDDCIELQEEVLSEFENKKHNQDILIINSDNYDQIDKKIIKKKKVVIITQKRLSYLALGVGEYDLFGEYIKEETKVKKTIIPRKIIIDEIPEYKVYTSFSMNKNNFALDWYDAIVEYPQLASRIGDKDTIPIIKVALIDLFNNKKFDDYGNTIKLLNKDNLKESRNKLIDKAVKELKSIKDLEDKIGIKIYQRFEIFSDLLYKDNIGKVIKGYNIDKVIVAKFVTYDNLQVKINNIPIQTDILILDGTATLNKRYYDKSGFEIINYKDYNNYTRLEINHRNINTSKIKRQNKNILNVLNQDISRVKNDYNDLFVLTTKRDAKYFISNGELNQDNKVLIGKKYGLNILNVRGNNKIRNVKNLYLTNLPMLDPTEYITSALVLADNPEKLDVKMVSELPNEERKKHKGQWFKDKFINSVYEDILTEEILQLIYRTSLRKTRGDDTVKIFIAYKKNSDSINNKMQEYFTEYGKNVNNKAAFTEGSVYDGSKYFRNEKIAEFSKFIIDILTSKKVESVKLSEKDLGVELSKKLKNFFRKNDNFKLHKDLIIDEFKKYGILITIKGERSKYFSMIRSDNKFEPAA